jgi:hypothetical protein
VLFRPKRQISAAAAFRNTFHFTALALREERNADFSF